MKLTIRAAGGAFAVLALGLGARAADYPTAPAYPASYHDAGGCATGTCATGSCGKASAVGGWLSSKTNDQITRMRYGQTCNSCCKPKLSAGGCYGYFRTQWTPWEAVCPTVHTVVIPAPATPPAPAVAPAPTPAVPAPLPTNPVPTTAPKPPAKEPAPAPVKEPDAKKDVPPAKDTTPTPPTAAPTPPKGSAPKTPGKLDERGLILPPVPDIPVVTPSRF